MLEGLDRCWSRVGVGGDATCQRLAEIGHCRNCEEYARAGRGLLDREASDALREDWSRRLAEPKPAAAARGDSVVVFQVCGEYLALHAVVLERITEARPVHSVPGRTSAVFTGLVNMDGELLPCFSVAAALKLGDSQPKTGRILVLNHGGARLACTVDQVLGVVRLPEGDLETPPVTVARSAGALTTAVFSVKGKRAGLLNAEKFMRRLLESTAI